VTPAEVAALRLRAQGIAGTPAVEPREVVARLGAVQAQDYLGSLWAVGLRMKGATERRVEQALADRTLVRTWPLRGTLHLVAAEDVRWMLALVAPRVIASAAGRFRQLGLDEATFSRSRRVLLRALSGGRALARPEVVRVLEAARISTAGQRGIHILWRLAQEGLLCHGPRAGKQQTFVLLDEWVPATKAPDREEALAELARRYFTGHGPATLQDFSRWTGLAASDARAALALAAPRLAREELGGRVHWSADGERAPRRSPPPAVLLPPFDELVVGYGELGALLDGSRRGAIHPTRNGMVSATLLVDGRIAGTWRRTLGRGGVTVELLPFAPLSARRRRALAAAARRYARFLGLPLAEG
jgi:hypothetical protein